MLLQRMRHLPNGTGKIDGFLQGRSADRSYQVRAHAIGQPPHDLVGIRTGFAGFVLDLQDHLLDNPFVELVGEYDLAVG